MKRLKKISLEDFDRLSSMEASRLIGGKDSGNGTIPPPKNTTPSSTTPPPVYCTVKTGGNFTAGINSGNWGAYITGGKDGISGGGISYRF